MLALLLSRRPSSGSVQLLRIPLRQPSAGGRRADGARGRAGRARRGARREPVRPPDHAAGRGPRRAADRPGGLGLGPAAGHPRRGPRRTGGDPGLARGERRYLVDEQGDLFTRPGDDPPASIAALPIVEDRRAASAGGRSDCADPVDLDAATRLARSSRPTSAARPTGWRSSSRTRADSSWARVPTAGRDLRLLHAKPADAGPDPRGRSACCAAS
jgi:hypothetical protein